MKRMQFIKSIRRVALVFALAWILSFSSCKPTPKPIAENEPYKVEHPVWAKNATIYEVNIRQFTPEGTFAAFQQHLPRLKDLGVDILWIMPIHPIGELNRKGELGSYYSIKDYKAVNPEFGTIDDFKNLVNEAHKHGMKIIIDWVANHTSHDNHLAYSNPEFYVKDSIGNFVSPFDWTDVIQLNYQNSGLRDYMVGALKFWIEEADIDGYRCDVASMVPTDFWNRARKELDAIKPVFMLAEAEEVSLQEFAFDADYGWEFHHIMNEIAKGKKTVLDIDHYFVKEQAKYPKNTIRMHFTSNHDENSWNGTEFERLADAAETFAALTYVIPGMPLIYNGQEVGFNRRLDFFDKDSIDWIEGSMFAELYKKLNVLKHENSALAAGEAAADMVRVKTSNDVNVLSFIRSNENDKVFVVFNLSNLLQEITMEGEDYFGSYADIISGEKVIFSEGVKLTLEPWQFYIYAK
ncbi:MAG TPA: alpha-amylase family glycosyl hydrolase [Tenuifilaceae bacterium]|nr:alpha-amylase family glycosyl hydrolase [Tenuifilaceae bacterium]HPJ44628.1 alpha-amylase family glycosyl hydrolase [Tenuifilaceae bacterium]HRX69290.1 alpha-amylase family glycosyl hydrolase [Tenuifilaceae bacterium]